MATKLCIKCESRGGMNFMAGKVDQKFNIKTGDAQITTWTCPYCGYSEVETIPYTGMGVSYNSGIVQGPIKGFEDRGIVKAAVDPTGPVDTEEEGTGA